MYPPRRSEFACYERQGERCKPRFGSNLARSVRGDVGLDRLHRLVHCLAQLMHESGSFKWDQKIWGPTPAQARYDTRTDLGNTAAKDGDGYLYRGRTADRQGEL